MASSASTIIIWRHDEIEHGACTLRLKAVDVGKVWSEAKGRSLWCQHGIGAAAGDPRPRQNMARDCFGSRAMRLAFPLLPLLLGGHCGKVAWLERLLPVERSHRQRSIQDLGEHCHPWMIMKRQPRSCRKEKNAKLKIGTFVHDLTVNHILFSGEAFSRRLWWWWWWQPEMLGMHSIHQRFQRINDSSVDAFLTRDHGLRCRIQYGLQTRRGTRRLALHFIAVLTNKNTRTAD